MVRLSIALMTLLIGTLAATAVLVPDLTDERVRYARQRFEPELPPGCQNLTSQQTGWPANVWLLLTHEGVEEGHSFRLVCTNRDPILSKIVGHWVRADLVFPGIGNISTNYAERMRIGADGRFSNSLDPRPSEYAVLYDMDGATYEIAVAPTTPALHDPRLFDEVHVDKDSRFGTNEVLRARLDNLGWTLYVRQDK